MASNIITYNGTEYTDGGNGEVNKIEDAVGYQKSTIVGNDLPYDTLEAQVWDFSRALLRFCTSDATKLYQAADGLPLYTQQRKTDLTTYTYGAPVKWTHGGETVLLQYLKSCRRIGKYKFALSCVSGIGLIAEERHYGGLYADIPFASLLADITRGAFKYTVDPEIGSISVYGWLPVSTRRENLRQLLTSSGAIIRNNTDGSIRFSAPATTAPKAIADERIEIDGTVDYPTPYEAVKITEHAFVKTPADLLMTLFDGETAAEEITTPEGKTVVGAIITFEDPMHDLVAEGAAILESGVNYAVMTSSYHCTLTGYRYSHTKRVIAAGSRNASEQATMRLENCTLVNGFNSEAVAQRWLAYYASRKNVSVGVVWNGEQPSDAVTLSDPYDEPATGIVSSLDVRLSGKILADMTIQAGTIPAIVGNFFQHVLVVTQSGHVTIPAEAKGKARLVLISGAQGGSAGYPGENGEDGGSGVTSAGAGGKGGVGGEGGSGGRIYVATISVAAGTVLDVNIGVGGAGAVYTAGEHNEGAPGTDTTCAGYTSANGVVSDTGYIEQLTGTVYGAPGDAGEPGADGGRSGFIYTPSSGTASSVQPKAGGNVGEFSGGLPGANMIGAGGEPLTYFAAGGGGGAASADEAGENGTDGYIHFYTASERWLCIGGDGGKGADATTPPSKATANSNGGKGGFGGGGGGGGGPQRGGDPTTSSRPGVGGTGGKGSNGGQGADGVLLIYY